MSNKHHKNISILKKFVEKYDLQDNYSNIRFNCSAEIETEKNFTDVECEAMISFDAYNDEGILTLMRHDLNPYDYPTVFKAKYNDFENITHGLIIKDTHPSDKIGKYKATIIEKGRTK